MGLFGFHKKKKLSKNDKNPDLAIPKYDPKKNSDTQLKEVINAETKEKTIFNAKKVNKEKEYIDEVMEKNLDLNSNEINMALTTTQQKEDLMLDEELEMPEHPEQPEIHPEIKNKLNHHHEIIHIDLPNEEIITSPTPKPIIQEKIVEKKMEPISFLPELEKRKETKLIIEPPKKAKAGVLPSFDEERLEIQNTRKLVEDFKKKRTFNENIFVKSTLYKEILHSNLNIKEDIKTCNSKIDNITKNISAQSNKGENLRNELESIQDSLLTVEDKLFDNNPLMR